MKPLIELLSQLPLNHRLLLEWFDAHAGTDQVWPKPLANGALLASKAKGIYKPAWTKYAISIRQNLNSHYPDREPILRPDGTWSYSYFQEGEDPGTRDSSYTNRGLVKCWQDKVPIGVMRQIQGKPNTLYRILGLALVAGWKDGYFLLEGFGSRGFSHSYEKAIEDEIAQEPVEDTINTNSFDPESTIDGRERAMLSIVRRRGQPEFRRKLLELYQGQCAISDCDAVEALEAAHITPYRGPATNHPSNGLCLRADLHTLFDLGLLTIDPVTMTVILAPQLRETSYGYLAGKPIRLPEDIEGHPNIEALEQHRKWAGL